MMPFMANKQYLTTYCFVDITKKVKEKERESEREENQKKKRVNMPRNLVFTINKQKVIAFSHKYSIIAAYVFSLT